MHPITEMNIDHKMQAEQIAEARRLRPLIWLIVFLAPIGMVLGLGCGILLGGR